MFNPGPPSTPVAPLSVTEITRNSATITWQPPENDGGKPLKSYNIELRESTKTLWKKVEKISPDITSYCVQNLTVNASYFFRVFAENEIGVSEPLQTDVAITIKSPYGNIFHSSLVAYDLFCFKAVYSITQGKEE